jgi:homoserine acetyltransferase
MLKANVRASYAELSSSHGHDGFLADTELLEPIIRNCLDEKGQQPALVQARQVS